MKTPAFSVIALFIAISTSTASAATIGRPLEALDAQTSAGAVQGSTTTQCRHSGARLLCDDGTFVADTTPAPPCKGCILKDGTWYEPVKAEAKTETKTEAAPEESAPSPVVAEAPPPFPGARRWSCTSVAILNFCHWEVYECNFECFWTTADTGYGYHRDRYYDRRRGYGYGYGDRGRVSPYWSRGHLWGVAGH